MSVASTATSAASPTKSKSVGKIAVAPQPVHTNAADRVSNEGGKRMYKMADGKSIELPADMTAEEAARLESEGNAAKKSLGKGPAPKPVPDVKAKAKAKEKKGDKKVKPKPGKKKKELKKGAKGKGKKGGAKGKKIAIRGKVGAWLLAKGAPSISRGKTKLAQLKTNEQKHDDAASKLAQTQKAVVPPALEGQSKGNAGQVKAVDAKPAPPVKENEAKQALNDAIQANIPQSIEDVDNFKRNNKAGHMSAAAGLVVQTDKNAVSGTFGDLKQTPPPVPTDVKPEPLPPEEIAPVTAKMNLGANTIMPLQKEHTDVSKYTNEADAKLKEEGVTQEQLDMVDSGDLAEANKEKKGMAKKAKTEPEAVKQFAQQQNKQVDKDLQQEESKGRDEIKNHRKKQLGSTKEKQQATKTGIEKKREEVTNKINQIYTDAQTKVTKKLSDLETVAMKRFDDGNAAATKEFENNVKSELDAFKDDRYSGWFGWARKAKDWLLGMDDLPQVKAIFDRNRAKFVTTVNSLVETISADNKKVVQECKDELTAARTKIQEFVEKLGPELQDVGKKAQEEMNGKLDELDQTVAKKEEELQNKLQDKQKAAIKAIDEKIEKMKEEMSGALAKLGALLLLAAKKFFTWALEKFGFSLAEIEGIINKGAAVLKAIFTKPIQFVKNLMNAAITGFQNFGKNFLKHLKNALFEWLTGSLEGLVLPQTWDFKGIIGIALQMIGISYQNIRRHMVEEMGEPVVAGLEKTFTLVKTLVTEGPMAAWEQLKEMAGEMRDAFIEAVKDFIKTKIIEQAIQWVVSLFVPGAGIIKAIIGIYDTIVFFIQKAKQIMQMIGNFLSSIGEIAAGNIGAAADAMENGLARGLSLVINFMAGLLHLNGITDKIRNAIQKIKGKVDAVLSKVAKWIKEKAMKLIAPVTAKVDQAKEWGKNKIDQAKAMGQNVANKFLSWWTGKKNFKTKDGHNHSLYFKGNKEKSHLVVASAPKDINTWLTDRKAKLAESKQMTNEKQTAIITLENTLIPQLHDVAYPKTTEQAQKQTMTDVDAILNNIAAQVKIIGVEDLPPVPKMTIVPGFSKTKPTGTITALNIYNDPDNHQPGEGTENSQLSLFGAFEEIEKAKVRPYWSRAHILNADFGGKNVESNIIPLPQSDNKKQVVFDAILKKSYSFSDPSSETKKPIWLKANISRDHDAEKDPGKLFVSYIKIEGGEMTSNGTKWDTGPTGATFEASPPVPGAPVPISLKTLTGTTPEDKIREIAKSNGIPSSLVRAIVADLKAGTPVKLDEKNDLIEYVKKRFSTEPKRIVTHTNRINEATISFD